MNITILYLHKNFKTFRFLKIKCRIKKLFSEFILLFSENNFIKRRLILIVLNCLYGFGIISLPENLAADTNQCRPLLYCYIIVMSHSHRNLFKVVFVFKILFFQESKDFFQFFKLLTGLLPVLCNTSYAHNSANPYVIQLFIVFTFQNIHNFLLRQSEFAFFFGNIHLKQTINHSVIL